jgi:hypothetical protein
MVWSAWGEWAKMRLRTSHVEGKWGSGTVESDPVSSDGAEAVEIQTDIKETLWGSSGCSGFPKTPNSSFTYGMGEI